MRFFNALKNDIRFQMNYGFYLLYAFFSAVYIAVLLVTPPEYKATVASLILLTDPAMLGFFFIGGIWLLEKGEGLHRFWSVSPLRPMEYLLSKSISLALLSTLSADLIVCIGMGQTVHIAFLSLGIFFGAVVFNLLGLIVASYAHSVNHYMIISLIPLFLLSLPPVLTAFGLEHPILDSFPGTALWHMIVAAIGAADHAKGIYGLILLPWLGALLILATKRIGAALQAEGGKGG